MFLRLAQDFPDLKPALDKLARDHHVVAHLNTQITQLIDELEAHFTYEETYLGAALDAA